MSDVKRYWAFGFVDDETGEDSTEQVLVVLASDYDALRAEVERLREIFRYECLIWCRCALFMSNERDETLHEDTCPYRKSILGTTDQPSEVQQ